MLVDVRPEPTDLRLLDTWDVTFAGFGGDPVRAWYTRPAGVTEPLPAVVEYAGYGRGPLLACSGFLQDRVDQLEVNDLGQLAQMSGRVHTPGYLDRPGDDRLILQRDS